MPDDPASPVLKTFLPILYSHIWDQVWGNTRSTWCSYLFPWAYAETVWHAYSVGLLSLPSTEPCHTKSWSWKDPHPCAKSAFHSRWFSHWPKSLSLGSKCLLLSCKISGRPINHSELDSFGWHGLPLFDVLFCC
jgi:hypothetical protein